MGRCAGEFIFFGSGLYDHADVSALVKPYSPLNPAPPLPNTCRYAFGITMWEIYTSGRPFPGVPQALLGHAILTGKRPEFPRSAPPGFVALAEACWCNAAAVR